MTILLRGTLLKFNPREISVRARVTILATSVLGVALVIAAISLILVQRNILTDRIDQAILNRSSDIAALIESGQLPPRLIARQDEESFIQIVDAADQVIASSDNIAGGPPLTDALAAGVGTTLDPRIFELEHAPFLDSDEFRMVVASVETPDGPVLVFVGGSLEPIEESTEALTFGLAVGIPILTLLVGLASWLLTGRALAPVEAISAEVAEISGSNIERRVPVPRSGDEISRLAQRMNLMLDRLEEAQARQRRFVSDASHELRSPLTAIRTILEVSTRAGSKDDHRAAINSSLEDVRRLENLIEDLLAEAELTASVDRKMEPVDLDDIVLEEASALRLRDDVTIETSSVSGAQVVGNREQLRRAVRNLMENAYRYAESRVIVALREGEDSAELAISDDGPGVPADQRDHIFERFARGDDARNRESGGTGLGLAITRGIAVRHGGKVYLDAGYDEGARFVLQIPREPDGGA